MYCDQLVTTDARQIAITSVDKGSPADGLVTVGDVILGVGGKPFSFDPRTEFGKAICSAEKPSRWWQIANDALAQRKVDEVELVLPELGSFSDSAHMTVQNQSNSRPRVEVAGWSHVASRLHHDGGS